MNKAYLLIGGNMGDRLTNLSYAYQLLDEHAGRVITASPLYETEAWGITNQPAFINQVLLIETNLSPYKLLEQLLSIEEHMGRKREIKYGPRLIDIDILFYNSDVINSETLIIPHPEMQNRRFVLQPLSDIAVDFVHPVFNKTVGELLKECGDKLEVKSY